jgi:Family of unknown function (DUF5990)
MAKRDEIEIAARIVIENPVPGVLHSLQGKDGYPLDPKQSTTGEPLKFEFPLRIGAGPKFFGDQVRREGTERRFVYIRIGTAAGQMNSPWSRRMKIDIHDMEQPLIERALAGGTLELVINGTAKDGSPACATIRPVVKRIA